MIINLSCMGKVIIFVNLVNAMPADALNPHVTRSLAYMVLLYIIGMFLAPFQRNSNWLYFQCQRIMENLIDMYISQNVQFLLPKASVKYLYSKSNTNISNRNPADIQHKNNAIKTSKRRHYVVLTSQ